MMRAASSCGRHARQHATRATVRLSSSQSDSRATSPPGDGGASPPEGRGSERAGATTHFGYREVPADDKEKMVGEVFSRVASSYDLMNDLMSAGIHRAWKDHFVHAMGLPAMRAACVGRPDGGLRILDVAGGTGDIAFRISKELCRYSPVPDDRPEITVCDINPQMLEVGQQRAAARPSADPAAPTLSWVEGNAEELPFEDESFDLYSIAFGIRNVTNVPRALVEARRVLRPGGRFVCLEFSRVTNPVLQAAYDAYSFKVIPALGGVVANDRQSYQYLVESIRRFPDQERFASMVQTAGLGAVTYTNLTAGVAAVHSGFKI